jgi:hypothetical protein
MVRNFLHYGERGEIMISQIFGHKKVVLLPEKDYKEMLKAKRNAEYLTKLDSSFKQIEEGKKVAFTVEELEAMAK